ncbi:DUF4190 domain-containing protein [Leucobacter albus]|uniref:DUF4190 domain-containing protein n=1 Tax=Leucobacter albus TaxID=272210 RepID=A0ABW3TQ87_9MICO
MSTTPPAEPTPHATEAAFTQPTEPLTEAAFTQPTAPLPESYAGQPYPPSYGAPYDQGAAAAAYSYGQQAPERTTVSDTNTYALISIIVTFMMPLAGIIFGHMGLSQIKRTGDRGRGLALTGLIYGYCVFALGTLFIILYIGAIVMLIGAAASGSYYYS